MRIISGKFGGRKIHPPSEMPYTRPTTDIAKEGLFNILQNQLDLEDAKTLDLFGGTGAISYELASHGAGEMVIVEKDVKMAAFIKKNMEDLKIENYRLIKSDVFKFLEQCEDQFDFIFAGPPYALETIDDLPKIITQKKLIAAGGLFVLEHTPRNFYEDQPGYTRHRKYGTTVFTFFEPV